MMDPAVIALLEQHKAHLSMQENGRILCTLNQHSLPASRQALETFLNGKKYAQLRRKADEAKKLQSYEPFLLPSKNFPGQLYCSLTCQVMEARLDTVKKHMSGRRFASAKDEFEHDTRELMEEPELESSEEAEQDMLNGADEGAVSMEEDITVSGDMQEEVPLNALPDRAVSVAAVKPDAPKKVVAPSLAGSKRKSQESSINKFPRTRGKHGKRRATASAKT